MVAVKKVTLYIHCTGDLYFYTLHDVRTKNSSDAAFLPRGGMPIVMTMLKVARKIIECAATDLCRRGLYILL